MKDHTIYTDDEAKTLASIEDAELIQKADSFFRRMASAESFNIFTYVYAEASTWLLSLESQVDRNTRAKISRIIEAVSLRTKYSYTLNASQISAA